MTKKQKRNRKGPFVIYRRVSNGFKRKTPGGGRMPWFRHPTFESAHEEAKRLADQFPDSTFVVMYEAAVVNEKPEVSE